MFVNVVVEVGPVVDDRWIFAVSERVYGLNHPLESGQHHRQSDRSLILDCHLRLYLTALKPLPAVVQDLFGMPCLVFYAGGYIRM